MDPDEFPVQFHNLGADAEHAPLRHGIPGIGGKVHQDLLNLHRVGHYRHVFFAESGSDIDILPQQPDQQLFDFADYLVQVCGSFFEECFSAESKQRIGQAGGPVRRSKNLAHVVHQRVIFGHFHGEESSMTDDYRKHIVEVMGNPPRKGSYSLHLLRLSKLHFQVSPPADIPDHSG
ncbi:MAG: hypothetical protein ACD_75C00401G0001 [uncultured bacterium]|nr:MAG: hypothetical protein ACD_75C00401G0001 [uncultured bacterium]